MRMIAVLLVFALLVIGSVAGYYRTRAAALEHEKEQARIEAAQTKRKAEEADVKNAEAIIRLKAETQRYKAEVTRLRSAAASAAKEVKAVQAAGETLVASGTTDDIIAAAKARGYNPVRCLPSARVHVP